MNTMFFKYAIEVDRTHSITQAAENLFISQPSLSKAIRENEEVLGYNIFERTSKGVIPTKQGEEFLKYARNIVSQLDNMEKIGNPGGRDVQRLSVSIPRGSYIAQGVCDFVVSLDRGHGIDVDVKETNSVDTVNNVFEGRNNLGIIRCKSSYEQYFLDYLDRKQLKHEQIWEFEYLALMSEKHGLAACEEVKYEELKKYIEIVHGDMSVPFLRGTEHERAEEHNSRKIYLYERCNQFELLSGIPETYMWVSPVPEKMLSRYGLVQRRCSVPDHKYKDLLIYPQNYKFTETDRIFIDKLYAAKTSVAFKQYN